MSLLQARLHERTVSPTERQPGTMTLADLPRGCQSVIVGLSEHAPPEVARRLFDLGFVPGMPVDSIRRAPLADPMIFGVAGYEIALRRAQARLITVGPTA